MSILFGDFSQKAKLSFLLVLESNMTFLLLA